MDKDLDKFLKEIAPQIKWLAQAGWNYCYGCAKTMDSSEKLFHYRVCSKPILEVPLGWYKNQIKVNANLPMDFKPTGSPIDETMYPSTQGRKLSSKDVEDLADLFSGRRKCRVKQVYTKVSNYRFNSDGS